MGSAYSWHSFPCINLSAELMRSVQTKFMLYTVPLVLLVTEFVFALFEFYARNSAQQQLSLKLDKLLAIQSTVVSDAVWNVSETQTKLFLTALLTDPDIIKRVVLPAQDTNS